MNRFNEAIVSINEARNNTIAPHNVYSTEAILNVANKRGDRVIDRGNLLFIQPTDEQPCEYAQFTKRNYCLFDRDAPEWGKFSQYMKPMGVKFTLVFEKSEEINKKHLHPTQTHAVVAYNQPLEVMMMGSEYEGSTDEEIARMMMDKASSELGVPEEEVHYTMDELIAWVSDLRSHTNLLWELYDSNNKLVTMTNFKSYLSKNGVSPSEMDTLVS